MAGTMGIAILGGILDSIDSLQSKDSDTPTDTSTPSRLPTTFNACVRSNGSAKRISNELGKYDTKVSIHQNDNLTPVRASDIVLLACKPYMTAGILGNDDMRAALKGKLLISILAGVPEKQISDALYPSGVPDDACTIVRAMPNTAAAIRESMTVINTSTPPLPEETSKLVSWIFTRIGRVVHLPPSNMDACTALCGSGPAFGAVMIESMAMGAIAMGVPRDEAYTMAAQTLRGMAGLALSSGDHPAVLRDKVSTPGGCTIGGLLALEEGNFRATVARAVREATVVASQLGEGKQGVNGTRH